MLPLCFKAQIATVVDSWKADKDLKINDTELDLESLKTPQLHNKYMKHYTKFKLLLTRTEDELRTMKRDKWEYYTGKLDDDTLKSRNWEPFPYVLKSEITTYLESDDDIFSQAEDTLTILRKYVDQIDSTVNKPRLENLLRTLYSEALSIE